ncbi:MAG: Imm63 family immunity protein [Anaerolineaceae bacterium]|nr:Imm63 family immunity protein [Anaerolineaceae bacterium]
MLTLNDVKDQVDQLARVINVPGELLPTYGSSIDFAHPHIEIHGPSYHYIIIERGQELDNKRTFELYELLYWIFQHVTFSMASTYELEHRKPHVDTRRLLFSYQLDLLNNLNKNWKKRRELEIEEILKHHPYSDIN